MRGVAIFNIFGFPRVSPRERPADREKEEVKAQAGEEIPPAWLSQHIRAKAEVRVGNNLTFVYCDTGMLKIL